MPAPGGFPYWTLGAGLAGAAVLAFSLSWIIGPRRSEPSERWQPKDALLLLVIIGVALVLRLLFLEARVVDNDEPVSLGLRGLSAWARETDARLHPPLPALLMALASHGTTDLVAARGISVLAGVATVSALRSSASTPSFPSRMTLKNALRSTWLLSLSPVGELEFAAAGRLNLASILSTRSVSLSTDFTSSATVATFCSSAAMSGAATFSSSFMSSPWENAGPSDAALIEVMVAPGWQGTATIEIS